MHHGAVCFSASRKHPGAAAPSLSAHHRWAVANSSDAMTHIMRGRLAQVRGCPTRKSDAKLLAARRLPAIDWLPPTSVDVAPLGLFAPQLSCSHLPRRESISSA